MSIRITEKRRQILDVLKKHKGAFSAAEIHAALPDIDLVTIYRNLDLFVKEKMIRQVYLGTEEARYEYQHVPHHHAVCTDCDRVMHFSVPEHKIKKILGLKNFAIQDIEMTVRGTCGHKNNR